MRRSAAPSQRFAPPAIARHRPRHSSSDALASSPAADNEDSGSVIDTRKPLGVVQQQRQGTMQEATRRFNVVYCKSSTRKHKKFEDDGVLVVRARARLAVLKDANSGREIARGSGLQISKLESLGPGEEISFGGKDIEVMDELEGSLGDNKPPSLETASSETSAPSSVPAAPYRPKVITKTVFKPFAAPARFGHAAGNTAKKSSFVTPAQGSMFDSSRPDALVLPRPPFDMIPNSEVVVTEVVVDPHISKHLRPHQRLGIEFLYKSVMGFNGSGGDTRGAILADEMGLGKTLQTIALIWTLLKQGPLDGRPLIKRALILAPSSLVKNWQAEFTKWLGSERISVFAVDQSNKVGEYVKYPNLPVLVLSYEMFVKSFAVLERVKFDLVVCDEGHRLKNDKVKASTLLSQMTATDMRVVLTGTPLQNDLKEFYAIVNVVCPNAIGTPSQFARRFEDPIVRSKQPEASEEEIEEGRLRTEELNALTAPFILRRTQDVISKFLPPKTEMVLFCRPTQTQVALYEAALNGLGNVYSLDASCVLSSILRLRKICNHPSLSEIEPSSSLAAELQQATFEEQGSKLAVVSYLLHDLRQAGDEKIVLVSISTQVLDLLEDLCRHYEYPYLRLDGSTSAAQRHLVVTRFNANYGKDFVLLLSSKAGGTGLNLIGASRILLYDMDWNPAHDIQAMARVWRDGQTKPVKVYRLVTTGTIEEKIFQRQITKQGLGGGVVGAAGQEARSGQFHFSKDELRDLFTLRSDSSCDTHDLLDCDCDGTGSNIGRGSGTHPEGEEEEEDRPCQIGGSAGTEPEAGGGRSASASRTDIKDLLHWKHVLPPLGALPDDVLSASEAMSYITYGFLNVQHA